MAEEAPVEDFNSRNVKYTITAIIKKTGRIKKSRITFQNYPDIILLSEIIEKRMLVSGLTLSLPEILELEALSRITEIRERAFVLLAGRPHSRLQLKLKLLKKGFQEDDISRVIDDLSERGYLDDAAFARLWLSSLIKKGNKGRFALLRDLARAGIDRQIAQAALREYSEEQEYNAILDLVAKNRNIDRIKLMRRLHARGFPLKLIRKALNQE